MKSTDLAKRSPGAEQIREAMPERERAIFDQRYAQYGDPIECHRNIGRVWAATLSQYFSVRVEDIPPDVVALMFTQFKAIRAVKGDHQDNYDDMRNYSVIAEVARKERT